ncbi:MAG: hypothetical protein HY650_09135 [Acidobacteria bacterium]|nr:hypothetical protein [Acidobacteriota bacterium]
METGHAPPQLGELLDRAANALGGLARITSVSTFSQEARVTLVTALPVSSWTSRHYRAQGGRIRIEEWLDPTRVRIAIVNGSQGWQRDGWSTNAGACFAPLPAADVEWIRREARCAPRNLIAHASEHSLSEPAYGVREGAAALKVVAENLNAEYYFDPETFLCLELLDQSAGRTTRFRDYRTCDGIGTPWRIESIEATGDRWAIELRSARHNPRLEDDLFHPPEP